MRYFLGFIFAVLAVAQPPTVSNVRLDYVPAPNAAAPHSYMRFRWNLSSIGSGTCYYRILYGPTSSYGSIVGTLSSGTACQLNDAGMNISGQTAGSTVFYSVQTSFDNSTWSAACSGCTGSFTLAPLPSPHPALPQITGLWTPTLPNTSGYHPVTINSSCIETATGNTMQQVANAAVALQP